MLWLYQCTAFCTRAVQQFARVMYVLPVFYSCRGVAVPLNRVLYSRRATVARVMYVLPVLYSCRAVAVPLHRVLYARRATVSMGNVRFTRFVLVPCCGCTIAPCVGNVHFTRFCTRAVRVLCTVLYSCRAFTIAQSARVNVRFTRCTRAVLWLYHCTAFCTRAVQQWHG